MRRRLEIVLEFDDGPWYSPDEDIWEPTDTIAYAMDQINTAVPFITRDVTFVEARLDGKTLIDRNGETTDEVKCLVPQYPRFMEEVANVQTMMNLDKKYTVGEFVQEILTNHPDDSGCIYINERDDAFKMPCCSYAFGTIAEMPFSEDMQNRLIKEILVSGKYVYREYQLNLE